MMHATRPNNDNLEDNYNDSPSTRAINAAQQTTVLTSSTTTTTNNYNNNYSNYNNNYSNNKLKSLLCTMRRKLSVLYHL